jgi:NAD(P)H-dependent FMN reductase
MHPSSWLRKRVSRSIRSSYSVGAGWQAKPVAFVSYGGVSGGLRAVEQPRLVLAEPHTVTIRDSASFAGAWEQFHNSGALLQPERAERSMTKMLARLRWWGQWRSAPRAPSFPMRPLYREALNKHVF